MEFDFRDVTTGEPVDDPLAGTYPIMELQREHLIRYVMTTSQGAIVLRHIPLRMKIMIDRVRHIIYPDAARMEQEVRELVPYFQGIPLEDVEPEAKARLLELKAQLSLTDMYPLGVIVAPCLASMDDYHRLYERLQPAEREQLEATVQSLAAPVPPSRVDATALEIAKANGITLMDEQMLEFLTASQAAFWTSRIASEARAVERALRRK